MISLPHPSQMCWICGTAVPPETYKMDDHGSAVHERCHAAKLALATEGLRLTKMPPKSIRLKAEAVANW